MKRLVFLAVAALVASACMKVNLNIEVSDDGSAEVSGILAFNEAFIDATVGALGEDVSVSGGDDVCAQFAAESGATPPGSELDSEPFREGDFCGVQFSGSLSADEVASQLNSPADNSEFELRRQGDGWIFEFVLDDQLGTEGVSDGGALLDGLDLFGSAEFIVRVKLPGKQVEHNADSIESDGTMVWDVDLDDPPDRLFVRTEQGDTVTGSGGPTEDLAGETEPGDTAAAAEGSTEEDDGGGSSAGTVILIVVLVLLGLGLAAYYLMRKSGREEPATQPASGTTASYSRPASPPQPTGTDPISAQATTTAAATQPPTTEPAQAPEPASGTEPAQAPEPASPRVIASPTPEQATGEPIWDPVRRSYVQWDPDGSRWLTFDNASQTWVPEG